MKAILIAVFLVGCGSAGPEAPPFIGEAGSAGSMAELGGAAGATGTGGAPAAGGIPGTGGATQMDECTMDASAACGDGFVCVESLSRDASGIVFGRRVCAKTCTTQNVPDEPTIECSGPGYSGYCIGVANGKPIPVCMPLAHLQGACYSEWFDLPCP